MQLTRITKAIQDGDFFENPALMSAMEHTDEPVFHDEELDLYVWGITHFGTSWDYVPAPEIH